MSNDTDRLEHEAESHRSRVDSTLDELRDRFSVGQIVDEVSSYLKEGQGSDMARNLGRQVRDNPLALGLIGAGIAWLFTGDSARAEGRHLKGRYDQWRDDRDYDERFDGAFSGGSQPAGGYRAGTSEPLSRGTSSGSPRPNPYPVTGGASRPSVGGSGTSGSDGPGMTDKAKAAASSAGASVSDAASRAGSSISDAASSARDTAARLGHDASEAAWRAEEAAARRAREAGRGIYRAGRSARRTFLDTLYEEPLIMGGVALALGAAVGAALPSTRREDELMGSARDKMRDEAYAYGQDTVERAGHVAEKAYEAASNEADKKGLMPKGGAAGETLAEKASGIAKAAADAAKSEAKKEGLS
ncbi:DUF3618 domain-containing protein [Aurantimonas sp. C2-6-R+9]|uniref:DUF3618 domain-containing protein n=1 Tax=unclassified Aurantimonas TaxID=2638230 RepID=UPI002E183D1C|nr:MULTISPECIES: DUF3618 domain-containing protein [unclassified Aurantimonas]MEC5290742.1 DUF3618 domain-containing protein [Aurantimonas sp. C2-3-R2]MEC5324568.1 DUF3618 domain-containing protein [Aurantimonas sp. A3-2-R12]MEC5380758.1 DUF3618 domain-containing protein [Aurantimonas sp. C2-6-R+9]MEC5411807.1 DUF3618 domain-containing protein [Aurantimonas sp. C2-4-R8]